MTRGAVLLFSFLLSVSLPAQRSLKSISASEWINAGPMLGYVHMKEAHLWIQTKKPAEVAIHYRPLGSNQNWTTTEVIKTESKTANTAKFVLDEVLPGKVYEYKVFVNGSQLNFPNSLTFKTLVDWRFRQDPPEFTILAGSCSYFNEDIADRPGRPYGGDYQIFEKMADMKADVMLWLGDNVYMRPIDFGSRRGFLHRYTHDRSYPQLQRFLQTGSHIAIWDDHDFGPNDANGSYVGKVWAHEAFRLFWANPPLVQFGCENSIASAMEFNDVHIFLLDNRSFRTEIMNNGQHQIFGREQLDWLINNLKYSNAPFKLVCAGGQMVSDAKVFENFANYEEERAYLFRRIEEENIKGVIFLTGDRHHSEVCLMTNRKGNKIFDFTTSPLTSGAVTKKVEENSYRINGSLIQQRNFLALHFSGKQGERKLQAIFYSSDGDKLFEYTIHQKEL
ncbi:alkaline phosphatase D family protein [Schleiferia thermophila]|uniref:Alkaline phosphatase D n=1 Tax=Schleiferia thermophila TaxID=884107 RepID=A0A369A7T5_9FLAO|nr:alkaline phosphatase D family protein [Schleiferia thermophila]RCX05422.1 alkaline phosphatase D [Schleiferia thermophila]